MTIRNLPVFSRFAAFFRFPPFTSPTLITIRNMNGVIIGQYIGFFFFQLSDRLSDFDLGAGFIWLLSLFLPSVVNTL